MCSSATPESTTSREAKGKTRFEAKAGTTVSSETRGMTGCSAAAGNDSVGGDRGQDRVVGDSGDDVLSGGDGNDNDTLDGGAGLDAITYRRGSSGIQANLLIGRAIGRGLDTLVDRAGRGIGASRSVARRCEDELPGRKRRIRQDHCRGRKRLPGRRYGSERALRWPWTRLLSRACGRAWLRDRRFSRPASGDHRVSRPQCERPAGSRIPVGDPRS